MTFVGFYTADLAWMYRPNDQIQFGQRGRHCYLGSDMCLEQQDIQ